MKTLVEERKVKHLGLSGISASSEIRRAHALLCSWNGLCGLGMQRKTLFLCAGKHLQHLERSTFV
jgi:hypothetical protein